VARDAIAPYAGVPANRLVLTPGTSVSYWYVFKLLCEPGDAVLCPTPSYPLFDYIARLAGVEIHGYRMEEAQGWAIDYDHLERQVTSRTRAIVLISPHNPTGMVADRTAIERLASVAARCDLPIVHDEVFREFVYDGVEGARPADTPAPLVFTLNGFSKMFALPGLKVGWTAVSGDDRLVLQSIRTLEMIADTFLPVSEMAQFAAPRIFAEGRDFLSHYRREMQARRDAAVRSLPPAPSSLPAGGFHMVVPVSREIDEEALAIELLATENILVHPGYYYDIEGRHLVMAFVHPIETLAPALARVREHLR
jgi:aspartate/methionine/tyrosine aminotransferase